MEEGTVAERLAGGVDSAPVAGVALPPKVKPATLKEAYEYLLAACDAAGIDRSDAWTVRQLMQQYTGRKSSRAAPYTIEEFAATAARVLRRSPE